MAKAATNSYEPEQSYKVRVFDITYREDETDSWLARIYQVESRGTAVLAVWFCSACWKTAPKLDPVHS